MEDLNKFKTGSKVAVPLYVNKNGRKKEIGFRHGTIVEKCKNNFFRVNIETPPESDNYNECFFAEDLLLDSKTK